MDSYELDRMRRDLEEAVDRVRRDLENEVSNLRRELEDEAGNRRRAFQACQAETAEVWSAIRELRTEGSSR